MKLEKQLQLLTAFTILGKGQLHWITSPMGLLGCLASFQWLLEGVLHNIQNVIAYINDLLVHLDTHDKLLEVLEQVLTRLQQNPLKINLKKCIFGNKEVSYLGFTLNSEGSSLKKINSKLLNKPKPPTDVKTIWSFVGLCNFFLMHMKDFAINCHATIQTDPQRIWIQRRATAWTCLSSLLHNQNVTSFRTHHGFPSSQPSTCPNHWCHHWHSRHIWQALHNPHPRRPRGKILCNLFHIQASERSQKVISFPLGISWSHLGDGSL